MAAPTDGVGRRTATVGACSRMVWFVALWGAGVLALMAVAMPIRWLLKVV